MQVEFAGLVYPGFIEAFFAISKKRFPSSVLLESVQKLLNYCERQMELCIAQNPRSVCSLPKLGQEPRKLDHLKKITTSDDKIRVECSDDPCKIRQGILYQ